MTRPSPSSRVGVTFAALLPLAIAAASGACRPRDESAAKRADSAAAAGAASALALPSGPWHRVAQDAQTLVAVDTSAVVRRPDGDANVRLLYAFAESQRVPGQPELEFRTIRSDEVTECARATSHPNVAVLYDSAGKEVGRATRPAGPQPPGMIGDAGGALCAYLRASKKVR